MTMGSEQRVVDDLWAKHFKPSHRGPSVPALVRARSYYVRNQEAVKAKVKAWRAAHPEKIREISLARTADARRELRKLERARAKARRGLFDAHVLLHERQPKPTPPQNLPLQDAHVRVLRGSKTLMYRWRYENDPDFALRERMRRQLRKKSCFDPNLAEHLRSAMKANRASDRVQALLGYSIAALRAHLERQFAPGMDWAGLSRTGWHVDHIQPQRLFDLSTIEGVRACWALSNLRPLWAVDNLRKGGRVDRLV